VALFSPRLDSQLVAPSTRANMSILGASGQGSGGPRGEGQEGRDPGPQPTFWLTAPVPQVLGPSLWLPQPAFQETLRPTPAHGNQPPALAQGLGGKRPGFGDENVVLAPKSATLPEEPRTASLQHSGRLRLGH
jgi:hypothetical protein